MRILDLDDSPSTAAPTPIDTTPTRILDIDDAPAAPRAPEPELVPGESIVPAAKARADEEQVLLEQSMGISLGKAFYANGTKMLAVGEKTAMGLRTDWLQQPTVGEATERFQALIASEQRKDYLVPLKYTRIADDGALTTTVDASHFGETGLIMNDHSWKQLVARGPKDIPASLRYNVNAWLDKSGSVGLFRTRHPNDAGDRRCFAVMSDVYQSYSVDKLAEQVRKQMPKDAHANIVYDGSFTKIEVSFANDFKLDEVGVGRLHKVMAVISTSDDGTAPLSVSFKAVRIRCINCTLIDDEKVLFRKMHLGHGFEEAVNFAIGKAETAISIFGDRWRAANEQSYHNKYDGTPLSAQDVFQRLVAHDYVRVPGYGKVEAVELLMTAWNEEPGDTAAAVNRAITRLAHEGSFSSPWATDELEETAGRLLFQNVYQLESLTSSEQEMFA